MGTRSAMWRELERVALCPAHDPVVGIERRGHDVSDAQISGRSSSHHGVAERLSRLRRGQTETTLRTRPISGRKYTPAGDRRSGATTASDTAGRRRTAQDRQARETTTVEPRRPPTAAIAATDREAPQPRTQRADDLPPRHAGFARKRSQVQRRADEHDSGDRAKRRAGQTERADQRALSASVATPSASPVRASRLS